jgi:hypothetical protein
MGSPLCDYLRDQGELTYSFSLNVGKTTNVMGPTFQAKIATREMIALPTNSLPLYQVLYDTGAAFSIMPVSVLAKLLSRACSKAFSEDAAWDWLKKLETRQRSAGSIVADAISKQLDSSGGPASKIRLPTDAIGFELPVLISFPQKPKCFMRVNFVVLNTNRSFVILSAMDMERAFAVLVDPSPINSYINGTTTKIRFFEHRQSQFKLLEAFLIDASIRADTESKLQGPKGGSIKERSPRS